jgi:alpha-beta hydrolase superfamily lysophospholipase
MMETTFLFGPERTLVGTLAFADEGASATGDLGVILTNAGLIARTGPHGMNVALARALARIGVPSIRFDMSGLGDSLRPSRPLPMEEQFIADVRLAVDEAQARLGVRRFAMIGFCSGADVAHLVALRDERLVGLLLWDPYIYPTLMSKVVHFGNRVREFGLLEAVRRALRTLLLELAVWRRHWSAVAQGRDAPVRPPRYGRDYIPPAAEYGARLRTLLDRGADVKIIYSGGFPADYNYATQYRDSFRNCGIADRVSCLYLKNADHVLTTRTSQQALLKLAVEWAHSLQSRPARSPERVA